MGWPQCNSTLENERITEQPIWHDYTFHYLGLWLSAVFGLIAIVVSFFLIYMHATHYLKPYEQRHIIRILFMVPVYAAVSFLSYLYYWHSIYFEVLRDCYEAFAIASFFSLMCAYLATDLHEQKEYFRTITPKKWVWPMGWLQKCCGGEHGMWRTPRSGLTWFNVIWVCIFQYCFTRVFMTCVAVITQAVNRYCLESLNPAFAHVWVMVIEAAAVSIAMYAIIQFYIQVRADIQQHKPLLKVAAIKLVIFLSFWQNLLISFLTSAGAIKATNSFQTPDIKVGIPAMLICIEMALFAIFHIWAFSYRPYTGNADPSNYKGGFMGFRAVLDCFNIWDLVKAVGRAAKWLFRDRRHRHTDISYDLSRKSTAHSNGPAATQKFDEFGPTAYSGASQSKPTYGGEAENLLANPQAIGTSRPAVARMDVPPFSSHGGHEEQAVEIGVAQTSQDSRPHHYRPYQESGVVATPYPDPQGEGQGRNGRISMPYYPPPHPAPGRENMF